MTKYLVKTDTTETKTNVKSRLLNLFQPKEKDLSLTFFERNPNSKWNHSNSNYTKNKIIKLKWTKFTVEEKKLKITLVQETMN